MAAIISREAVAIVATTTLVTGAILWWLRHKAKKFVPVARVKKIFIYPVKSLQGIQVPYVHCISEGPTFEDLRDRCMMIVEDDFFVSQREEPSLAVVRLAYKDGTINVSAEGMPDISFPALDPDACSKERKTVRVRKNSYVAVDVSTEASAWFRQYLNKDNIHLVRILQGECSRPKGSTTPIVFQDSASFHVVSEASLRDLKSRIPDEPISERNFRPNFFIEGSDAYAEDTWSYVQLGDAIIDYKERCPRCRLTTVNPDTGIRTDKQPLATLRTYRTDRSEEGKEKYALNPLFGVRYFLFREGMVRVGDQVGAVVSSKPLV
ncbi:mitochondrial amidoxime reducing component 2-like [Ornithodoros turicata]|uniref:mitochondrial amidoxime reducing component 2-like n=1 Tax=Ornithodoros turicata TaxID=34597 RepID=UPI00313A0529